MPDLPPPPLTPATLAARWESTPDAVIRLCKAGRLRHFQIGKGQYRIPLTVVEEYERCASNCIETGGMRFGGRTDRPSAAPSAPRIVAPPNAPLPTSSAPAPTNTRSYP